MSYVENNLMKDESVVHSTKQHWIIFLWPVVFFFGGLYVIMLGMKDPSTADSTAGIAVLCILVGLVWFVMALLRYITNEFAITNKRVIIKIGVIRRMTLEMNLDKVESVSVDQSILGRILDYGTLVVSGTGSTKQPFKEIAGPIKFKKIVQER